MQLGDSDDSAIVSLSPTDPGSEGREGAFQWLTH